MSILQNRVVRPQKRAHHDPTAPTPTAIPSPSTSSPARLPAQATYESSGPALLSPGLGAVTVDAEPAWPVALAVGRVVGVELELDELGLSVD